MTIGEHIRELRKNNGLSQPNLAKLLGISNAAISRLETNTRKPSLQVSRRLADIFQRPVHEFLAETDILSRQIVSLLSELDTGKPIDDLTKAEIKALLEQMLATPQTPCLGSDDIVIGESAKRKDNVRLAKLKRYLTMLNDDGQLELIHQAQLLVQIPNYKENEVTLP